MRPATGADLTDARHAVRLIAGGATMLAGSVLADSGMEHYRGSFSNPAMALPLASSGISLLFNGERVREPNSSETVYPRLSHGISLAIGAVGFGFHVYNILKREGGPSFTNLFYAAPAGAPAALVLAGMLGGAADRLGHDDMRIGPVGLESGRVIGGLVSAGIVGTVAEAGLLHFRGAYHNPAMWIPVALPPVAAVSLARDAIEDKPRGVTTALLGATVAMGIAGVGFHAFGVARNMGGWRNWRQNLLAGPPIPAPPAFTGLAVAGLGALLLMKRRKRSG
ncbi:hypothetical protein [Stakelama tenebrarum]|uniref:Uncharacterized protein n=1 Tax=Stakelama tenebrarum TaxID=2711215 RepID=A0A6G6Y5K6_9SPHN|nr:hypothetical protein [Sphingosinithalassobacter tenebrarum]QIG80234.1 hypothetical protein G5C33_10890 [Sphingosinithalassobacter tenebrarum]